MKISLVKTAPLLQIWVVPKKHLKIRLFIHVFFRVLLTRGKKVQ